MIYTRVHGIKCELDTLDGMIDQKWNPLFGLWKRLRQKHQDREPRAITGYADTVNELAFPDGWTLSSELGFYRKTMILDGATDWISNGSYVR